MEKQEAASELQIAWHLEGGAPAGAIPTRWVAQDSTSAQLTVARAAILGGTIESVEEFVRSTRFDLEHSDTQWNDPQLALRSLAKAGKLGVSLGFIGSDYAAMEAFGRLWRLRNLKARYSRPRLVPWASHTFGVAVTLVSADGLLIVGRRGQAASRGQGMRTCAVNEGMLERDVDVQASSKEPKPSVAAAVVRGVEEELGLVVPASAASVSTLFVVTGEHQWGMAGWCDLRGTQWTASEILRAHTDAIDGWEADISAVEPAPDAVKQLLSESDWVPLGALSVAVTLQGAFGMDLWAMEKEFGRYFEVASVAGGTGASA